MRLKSQIFLILFFLGIGAQAADYKVASPDGKISVIVSDRLDISVSYDGDEAFKGTAGLRLMPDKTVDRVKSPRRSSVDREISTRLRQPMAGA